MQKIITYDTLRSYAYVNDAICKRPIRGVALSFFGLNGTNMFANDPVQGEYYAERGILYVQPYTNPWAWMNRQTVDYVMEIVDVLFRHYDIDPSTPIVSTGGSMGGQSAFVYAVYSKPTPVAVVANCPVCDMVYHFQERPDLPRTIYSAIGSYETDFDTALRSISPLHLIPRMPDIDYHIIHCTEDKSVVLEQHSRVFVDEMRKQGRSITLDIVPGRGHCDLTYAMKKQYAQYIVDAVDQHAKK